MSYVGYFRAAINNWYKVKKTPLIIKNMKEVYEHYKWWCWKNDFKDENPEDVEFIISKMKEIYKEIY